MAGSRSIYSWSSIPDIDDGRINITARVLRRTLYERLLYDTRILFIYSLVLWAALGTFYGVMFNRSSHAYRMHLQIVDFDHGPMGQQITRLILSSSPHTKTQPTWVTYADARTMSEARVYVRNHGWGAIVINAGLSDSMQRALNGTLDGDYNPSSALTILQSSGRNAQGSISYVQPALVAAAQMVAANASLSLVAAYKSQPPSVRSPTANPDILLHPVWYTTVDVAPYNFDIAPIAPAFGMFIPLTCTIAAQILLKISLPELYTKVCYRQLAYFFLFIMFLWSLILALNASLAFWAFKGPSYNSSHLALFFTAGRFFAILGAFQAALLACSQWLFFWITILPPDLMPIILVMLMVSSTCSSIVPIEMTPHFFRWFNALPIFNSTMLFRYITSGAYPRLARNIGILLSEIAAMAIADVAAVWVRQHWVFCGTADTAGWFSTSIFYRDPFPQPPKPLSDTFKHEHLAASTSSLGSETSTSEHYSLHISEAGEQTPESVDIADSSDATTSMIHAMYGT
ncbi:hypothetical protein GQ54DRAFT_298231 [Martensiomyces pterosporus]|nr:hypothetical protein GQ54DRAFT_298231 [Martensiomyces pterosporus]